MSGQRDTSLRLWNPQLIPSLRILIRAILHLVARITSAFQNSRFQVFPRCLGTPVSRTCLVGRSIIDSTVLQAPLGAGRSSLSRSTFLARAFCCLSQITEKGQLALSPPLSTNTSAFRGWLAGLSDTVELWFLSSQSQAHHLRGDCRLCSPRWPLLR